MIETTTTTTTDWLFRGNVVWIEQGDTDPAFVIVRTIDDRRFLCHHTSQAGDTEALETSLAGCNSITLE